MTSDRHRVLVVDGDDKVLDTAAVVLESLGYEVITARSGDEALAMLEAHAPLQVLMTEVVLPGDVAGRDLARFAKAAHPGIAVVYTTRYSPMLLLDSEAPRDGLLVRKPWDQNELKAELSKTFATMAQSC